MAPKKQRRASSAWPGLPSDLLGLVLLRLHSLTDRVHIAAVCRPWRSAARLQELPPPMPWVALGDEAYLDVANGGAAVRKLALGGVPGSTRCCRGSAGHLLFLCRATGGCFLADPFSPGAVLPVADLALFIRDQTIKEIFSLSYSLRLRVHKVTLLRRPSPHGTSISPEPPPIVAALIKNNANKCRTTVFVCRAGKNTGVRKESYGAMAVDLRLVKDVAFFHGKLYALLPRDELVAVELGEDPRGNPAITGVKRVIKSRFGEEKPYDDFTEDDDEDDDFDEHDGILHTADVYLVPSGEQLLMLRRWIIYDGTGRTGNTGGFDVFEADFGGGTPCRWKTVSSLRGRAIFLGRHCSESVHVGDGHYGAQEDCIYFVRQGKDSGIYDMSDGKVRPLVADTELLCRHSRAWIPTWIFPDQSIIQDCCCRKESMVKKVQRGNQRRGRGRVNDRGPVFDDILFGLSD